MTTTEEAEKNNHGYVYSRRNLYFSSFGVYILFLTVGAFMGWASPAIPKLKEEGHNYSSKQFVLLSSIQNLAPGPLITILGTDLIGRKGCLCVVWLTLVVSCAILCITSDINTMLVARFIGGWGMGASFSAVGIYISEISDVDVRGGLNTISMFFLALGLILTNIANLFLNYLGLSIVLLIISLLFGIGYFFLPESPYYYIAKGKFERARYSIEFLRRKGSKENHESELLEIKNFIEEERKNKTGIHKLFTSKVVFKQFSVAFYLLYMQQACCWGSILSFSQEIFDAAELGIEGAQIVLALSIFTIFSCIPPPFCIKKFATKHIFLAAGFGTGLCLVALGLFFILLNRGMDVSSIKYLPIVAIFSLNFLFYVGFGGVIWSVIADLFAPSVKGPATGICGIVGTLFNFVSTEVLGMGKESYGYGPTFMAFGICQTFASIGFFFVPDTTKMTFQEIQDYFEEKRTTPNDDGKS